MQHPVAIYADFESIIQPVDDDPHSSGNQPADDDPHSSGTTLKSKHICSGYSYTVVSPHCANRVETYRGEDAGKHFLESVMEEEIRLSTWLKENEKKEHDLSPDEERQWQAETKCHICVFTLRLS